MNLNRLLNMKYNVNKVSMLLFSIFAIIFIIIFFYDSYTDIRRLNSTYQEVDKNVALKGKVDSIETLKGSTFITFDHNKKYNIRPSCNFEYSVPCLSNFLQINDSVYKNRGSDSLFIVRNKVVYFFIIGEFINKE
jgi:hypothetical protein